MHNVVAQSLARLKASIAVAKGGYVAVSPRDLEVLEAALAGKDLPPEPTLAAPPQDVWKTRGWAEGLIGTLEGREAQARRDEEEKAKVAASAEPEEEEAKAEPQGRGRKHVAPAEPDSEGGEGN